ncbi:MAG TPA: hypothetical protein PLO33_07240 [Kouleothrix sp.]|uniref:hypothetical protein n=1 Tax=Kouleothrix sp. TaxID=2779161 RepID=UPI002B78B1BC|nr:hypothetical protein [Kouleothrix sp.]HRC75455.1 hypothetical protein [Kouleothrix sp.]
MIAVPHVRHTNGAFRLFRHTIVALTMICLLAGLAHDFTALLLRYLVYQLFVASPALHVTMLAALGGAIYVLSGAWAPAQPQRSAIDAAWWMALFPALGPCAGMMCWPGGDEAEQ